MDSKISQNEVDTVVKILSKLEPGFIPEPIFRQLTRIVTTAILEIVPLRKNSKNEVEVLLLSRPDDDPVWSNKLHTPGTVIRGNDNLDSAFERILTQELNIDSKIDRNFVTYILHKVARGNELAVVYFIDLSGKKLESGEFFNSNSLPDNIVQTQTEFIKESVINFKSKK